jgi:hypothetical protein
MIGRARVVTTRLLFLTAAYSHPALGEEVVSLVSKLEFCRFVFGRLDEFLGNKLIKNSLFVRLQIRAGSLQQIAKDRNFEVREIICHDIDPCWPNLRCCRTSARSAPAAPR